MADVEKKKHAHEAAVLELLAEDAVLAKTTLTEEQRKRLVAAISLFKGVPLNNPHATVGDVIAEAKRKLAETPDREPGASTSGQIMKQRS